MKNRYFYGLGLLFIATTIGLVLGVVVRNRQPTDQEVASRVAAFCGFTSRPDVPVTLNDWSGIGHQFLRQEIWAFVDVEDDQPQDNLRAGLCQKKLTLEIADPTGGENIIVTKDNKRSAGAPSYRSRTIARPITMPAPAATPCIMRNTHR